MPDLTIGEVARRSGLRSSAIRYYESQGILPAPRRGNGRRRYDEDVLDRLNAVHIARRAGFTIAEMRQLFQGIQQNETPSVMWRRVAETKLHEVEALISQAQAMKQLLEEGLRCGCLKWEDCALMGRAFPEP
jgi:MerR family transcriptional regulator, redox-sensitive transcriptional activator SoxR